MMEIFRVTLLFGCVGLCATTPQESRVQMTITPSRVDLNTTMVGQHVTLTCNLSNSDGSNIGSPIVTEMKIRKRNMMGELFHTIVVLTGWSPDSPGLKGHYIDRRAIVEVYGHIDANTPTLSTLALKYDADQMTLSDQGTYQCVIWYNGGGRYIDNKYLQVTGNSDKETGVTNSPSTAFTSDKETGVTNSPSTTLTSYKGLDVTESPDKEGSSNEDPDVHDDTDDDDDKDVNPTNDDDDDIIVPGIAITLSIMFLVAVCGVSLLVVYKRWKRGKTGIAAYLTPCAVTPVRSHVINNDVTMSGHRNPATPYSTIYNGSSHTYTYIDDSENYIVANIPIMDDSHTSNAYGGSNHTYMSMDGAIGEGDGNRVHTTSLVGDIHASNVYGGSNHTYMSMDGAIGEGDGNRVHTTSLVGDIHASNVYGGSNHTYISMDGAMNEGTGYLVPTITNMGDSQTSNVYGGSNHTYISMDGAIGEGNGYLVPTIPHTSDRHARNGVATRAYKASETPSSILYGGSNNAYVSMDGETNEGNGYININPDTKTRIE